MADFLPEDRIAAIADLRVRCGASRNRAVAVIYAALDDLLAERAALIESVRRHDARLSPLDCPLNRVKREALIYAAVGHSVDSHAAVAVISPATVRTRRRAAFRELGANGITEAVGLAVAHGWITPADLINARRPR